MRLALTLSLLAAFSLSTAANAAESYAQQLKSAAKAQAQTQVAAKLNLATPAPADAKVYFLEPKDGATVTGPVKVVFGLSGLGVAPAGTQVEATGHHHLLVDGPEVDLTKPLAMTDNIKHFGKGQTETTVTLAPGKHTLQLLFADWKHQPFNPSVTSEKITITVK